MTQAHTQARTSTMAQALALEHSADTAANGGMRTMRRTLAGMEACRALDLEPRTAPPAKPAARVSAATKRVTERKPAQDADTPEQMREWRVGVLVEAGDAHTCVWVSVTAPGMRRAGKQARADAFRAGHKPVGICATLRDDAPEAMLKLAV